MASDARQVADLIKCLDASRGLAKRRRIERDRAQAEEARLRSRLATAEELIRDVLYSNADPREIESDLRSFLNP